MATVPRNSYGDVTMGIAQTRNFEHWEASYIVLQKKLSQQSVSELTFLCELTTHNLEN